jgi:hypothetical protein
MTACCRSTDSVTKALYGTSVSKSKPDGDMYQASLTVAGYTYSLGTTHKPRAAAGAAIGVVAHHMEANGGQHPPPGLKVKCVDNSGAPLKDPKFYLGKGARGTVYYRTITEALNFYKSNDEGWVPPPNATQEQMAQNSIRADQTLEIWDLFCSNKKLPKHATT